MGAEKCYDEDLNTHCHTKTESTSSLTLDFDQSYVTKVRTINVDSAPNRERQRGAEIRLYDGDDEVEVCGTINDVSKREFTVDCLAAGSLVEIRLYKKSKPLHFSEVEIYGWGK